MVEVKSVRFRKRLCKIGNSFYFLVPVEYVNSDLLVEGEEYSVIVLLDKKEG